MTNLVIWSPKERDVTMNYIQIGKRIRKLRLQRGYTQEALAARGPAVPSPLLNLI